MNAYSFTKIKNSGEVTLFYKTLKTVLNGDKDSISEKDVYKCIKIIKFNDELIGFIGFSNFNQDGKKYLGLSNFMILPKYQSQGHGTNVVNDIINTNKNKYDEIYCWVDKNNTRAINFYKRIGDVYTDTLNGDDHYVCFYKKSGNNKSYVKEGGCMRNNESFIDKYDEYMEETTLLLEDAFSYVNSLPDSSCQNEIELILMEAKGAIDPAIQSKEKRDSGSENIIIRAAKALIKVIQNLIESIADFIDKLFMSSKERASFEAFKKELQKDPKLKGRPIRVKDFRESNKQHDILIAEADKKLQELERNGNTGIDDFLNRVKKFIGGTVGVVAGTVTAEAALTIAGSDINTARGISKLLKNEEGILNKLLKTGLGDKGYKSMKNDVNACTKMISVRKAKVQLLHGKYDNCKDALSSIFTDWRKLLGMSKRIATSDSDLGEIVRNTAKATGKEAVNAYIKEPVRNKLKEKGLIEDRGKSFNQSAKFYGVDPKLANKGKRILDTASKTKNVVDKMTGK